MRLYLVQHGKALAKEVNPERPLSEEGYQEVFKIANFLKDKLNIGTIWHSRKLRAIQTAQIFNQAGIAGNLIARDDLNPLDPVDKFPQEIEANSSDLMIVGHLPFLAKLNGFLLSGDQDLNLINFYPGGVVSLEREEGWRISWVLIPSLI